MFRTSCLIVAALAIAAGSSRAQEPFHHLSPEERTKIVNRMKEKDLLPKQPGKARPWRPIYSLDDVPEISFEEFLPVCEGEEPAAARIVKTLEQIRRLDRIRHKGFLQAVRERRPDLSGLPFRDVGAELDAERRKSQPELNLLVSTIVNAVGGQEGGPGAKWFPNILTRLRFFDDDTIRPEGELEFLGKIARQRLIASDADSRLALVQVLQSIPTSLVNDDLADLALFAPEKKVRLAAIASLKTRGDRSYSLRLVRGLEYPLPAVIDNATEALIALKLDDAVTLDWLASMVDRRGAQTPFDDFERWTVRELVKVNHHRNCMLCHPPSVLDVPFIPSADQLAANVPNPRVKLPESTIVTGGYFGGGPLEGAIRFDVTYLRPDFSLMLPVDEKSHAAGIWPETQRFDFLVRQRTLTKGEVAAYEKAQSFLPQSTTKQAALRVLRELTRLADVPPTSEDWEQAVQKYVEERREARRNGGMMGRAPKNVPEVRLARLTK